MLNSPKPREIITIIFKIFPSNIVFLENYRNTNTDLSDERLFSIHYSEVLTNLSTVSKNRNPPSSGMKKTQKLENCQSYDLLKNKKEDYFPILLESVDGLRHSCLR
jgi:hypothetical protein